MLAPDALHALRVEDAAADVQELLGPRKPAVTPSCHDVVTPLKHCKMINAPAPKARQRVAGGKRVARSHR